MAHPLLQAKGLNVVYEPARGTRIWSVRDVSLDLAEGELAGLVGESGCGKTTLGYALTRMLRPPARLEGGEIRFDGVEIGTLDGEELRRQRRNGFALVLQSGMNALNPVRTVEHHFGDTLRAHARTGEDLSSDAIRHRAEELLASVRLEPDVLGRFAHERSEEHTSELQSPYELVCRLLLEKKKKIKFINNLKYTKNKKL